MPDDFISTPPTGLHAVDWLILVLYAATTLAIGWYFGRERQSTREYFIGNGRMNPLLVGISLFATLLSTISYRSMPGEALGKGPVYLVALAGFPIVYLIVGYVLLPIYMRQRVTSAYELLESRLGLSVRLLGASLFVLLRLVWMSLLVYLTADAMAIMLGVPPGDRDEWIPLIVLVTGFVAVVYTSLGGLRAVVVTDLLQTVLLYGGALLVIGTVTLRLGGFGWFPTTWHENWDMQPIVPESFSTRASVLGTIVSMTVWYVATAGGDQTCVQRFMATTDARAARKAYAMQLITSAIVTVTLFLVGFALLGYFQQQPQRLPGELSIERHADDLFPYYIAFHLPPVVSGLVAAALFAAAMSSIDSGVNSIAAVVQTDFIERLRRKPQTEAERFRAARWLAFAVGAIVVVGSSQMGHVPGNITAVTSKTSNLLTVPIFCLFFFALLVPFATPLGVWVGALCGTATATLIAFSGAILGTHPEAGDDPISFQWIAPAALLVNIVAGIVFSHPIFLSWRATQK